MKIHYFILAYKLFRLKHLCILNIIEIIFLTSIVFTLIITLDTGISTPEYSRLHELALAGDTTAQTGLAQSLLTQVNPNIAEAKIWLYRAARAGEPVAQYNLALLLYEQGGEKNEEEAGSWLNMAARNGYAPAISALRDFAAKGSISKYQQKKLVETRLNEIRDTLHMLAQ